MGDLPDKIYNVTVLRMNKNALKVCTCFKRKFVVDPVNKIVQCAECDAIVDPFTALFELAMHYEGLEAEVNALLRQAKEINNYKPYLRVIKSIEQNYSRGKMLPICPHCHNAVDLADLSQGIWRRKATT